MCRVRSTYLYSYICTYIQINIYPSINPSMHTCMCTYIHIIILYKHTLDKDALTTFTYNVRMNLRSAETFWLFCVYLFSFLFLFIISQLHGGGGRVEGLSRPNCLNFHCRLLHKINLVQMPRRLEQVANSSQYCTMGCPLNAACQLKCFTKPWTMDPAWTHVH